MKKTAAVLLALSLLICLAAPASAVSEPFALRNGIVFGDTLETVKQKETFSLEQDQEEKTTAVWFEGYTDDGGYLQIRYDFDEDTGALTDMLYDFEYSESTDSLVSDFFLLADDLTEEYGSPLGFTDGEISIISGPAFDQALFLTGFFSAYGGIGEIFDYSEWIVRCDGYYVKVDLISFVYGDEEDLRYQNMVSYHYFTDKDFQEALQAKQEEEEARIAEAAGTDEEEDLLPAAAESGWQLIDGKWYYFGDAGTKAAGWQLIGETWYYFGDDGVMRTGWQQIGEKWHYFSDDGAMMTGWQEIDEKWYYFGDDGAMVTGWQEIDEKWYYFGEDGVMAAGWQEIDEKWYYFDDAGEMVTGWFEDREAEEELPADQKKELWYWFDENGQMAVGYAEIEGRMERFDENGLWMYTWNAQ